MDINYAPRFSERLIESASAGLQYLQQSVAMSGPAGQPWEDFWSGLGACTGLATLQLTFLAGQSTKEQVAAQ